MFQVYANGIRNIDLHYIIRKLAAPVISVLLLSLCIPYVIASGVVPLLGGYCQPESWRVRLLTSPRAESTSSIIGCLAPND